MATKKQLTQVPISAPATVPADLRSWNWEVDAGRLRLANAPEGWQTAWCTQPFQAIEEARAIVARDEATFAIEVAGRARVAQEAVNALGAGPPAPPWQPGPDTGGVFRRPPGSPEQLRVAPALLVDGRWQPRQVYDQAALDELTDSVREHGVITDLLVVINEQGEYELIAGHRRKRAALGAPVAAVPVKILEVTAAQAAALALIDNDQRADLTDVERGRAYEKMIGELGISEAELARQLGRPRAYIQQRRMLAQAAPELHQAVSASTISFTAARAICLGSAGNHAAQRAVLKEVLRDLERGYPVRGEELQAKAEQHILNAADAVLKKLGWKSNTAYLNGTRRTFFFAATAAPVSWSAAEILAVVADKRRPPEQGPTISEFTKDDRAVLSVRGMGYEAGFAPWPAVKTPDGKVIRFGDEAVALLQQAKDELIDVEGRFVRAGWKLTYRNGYATATIGSGKKKHEEHCYRWSDVLKLITTIEHGAYTPKRDTRQQAYTCPRCGERATGGEYRQFEGNWQTICLDCSHALAAEEEAARAAQEAAVAVLARDWVATAPPALLALIVAERRGTHAVKEAGAIGLAAAAITALAGTAWRYRNELVALGVALDAPATAVAPAPSATTSQMQLAPPSLKQQLLSADAGATPYDLPALDGWLDALAAQWDAGVVTAADVDILAKIGALLDDLAEAGHGTDAEAQRIEERIDELAERLNALEVQA